MGGQLREGLDAIAGETPEIVEVRGKGLMLGVELGGSDGKPDPALAGRVMEEAKAGRLLVGKGGLYGNSLRIAPPLSVTGMRSPRAWGSSNLRVKRRNRRR